MGCQTPEHAPAAAYWTTHLTSPLAPLARPSLQGRTWTQRGTGCRSYKNKKQTSKLYQMS